MRPQAGAATASNCVLKSIPVCSSHDPFSAPRCGEACRHYFTIGGTSKVWKGAGLGTVHSSPSAPSQGLTEAGIPPLSIGSTTANRKYTWLNPNQLAPIVATIFQSVNCAG